MPSPEAAATRPWGSSGGPKPPELQIAKTPGPSESPVRRLAVAALPAALLLMFAWPVTAQPAPRFGVDRWTTEDGLPSENIADLVQAEDGYLWLIASGWIVRFDGYRFVTLQLRAGDLPEGRPMALAADTGGRVWALLYEPGLTHIVRFTGGRPSLIATVPGEWTELLPDGEDRLWLANYREVRRFDGAGLGESRVGRLTRVQEIGMEVGPQWMRDRSGDIWLRDSMRDSIGHLSEDGIRLTRSSVYPALLSRPSTGDVLIPRVRGDTVTILDKRGGQVATIRRGEGEVPRLVDKRGRLWVSTPTGLDVYASDSMHPVASIPVPAGLITGLVEDREGNLWARTFTSGLFRLRELPAQILGVEDGLRTSQVMMVTRGARGSMLATDRDGRAYRIMDGRARLIHEPDPTDPQSHRVLTVAEDRGGTLWMVRNNRPPASADGREQDVPWRPYSLIGRRDGQRDQVHPIDLHVRAIAEDPRTGHLWFVSPDVYRGRVDASSLVLADTFRVDTEPVRDLVVDATGAAWIATDSALTRISDDGLQAFRGALYPAKVARSVLVDDDGTVWIGTYGRGLLRFRDNEFRAITEADGLAEDVVSSILDDGLGNLWLAGNRSIHRVSRGDLDAFLDGNADVVRGVAYGRRAGIPNPETSGWQSARSHDGTLWFATFGGIVIFDPEQALALDGDPPVVHIEDIRLANGGQPRAAGRAQAPDGAGVRLAPSERDFDVAYTAISLRDPDGLRFRYRLDGWDDTWREGAGARVATYTNVPAGRYSFQVQAVSAGGIPSPIAAMDIWVAPFFYETNGFMIALVLTALGGIVLLVRYRERQLVRRQAHLNELVAERTASLREASVRAETAMQKIATQAEQLRALSRARTRLFANVSHEFRTPLTLILGPLKDLQEGRLGELPPAAREEIEIVAESGRRLNVLVDELLDIARLEAGELKLSRRRGDAMAFLRRVARSFEPLARTRGIAFEVELPLEPTPLVFDADRLEKAITNLLGNAFKFTDSGGRVGLTGEVERGNGTETLVIRITDDGIGIPGEARGRIFDRFYQADDSTSRSHQGAGIGLAITKDFVELHGGTVEVDSAVGAGSTFTVRLPLGGELDAGSLPGGHLSPRLASTLSSSESDARPGPRVNAESADLEDRTTVLIVEDNDQVRAYLRRHFEERYRVVEAADGQKGLEEARRIVPDLIISDLMMPVMDGQTLVEEIRNDADIAFVPIILLTAKASHDSLLSGLRVGADDYLSKPFDVEELWLRAHNLIDSRRRLRERFEVAASTLPSLIPPTSEPADGAAAFLAAARAVLAEHIDDEEFGVEELARALFMSRSTLYRRAEQAVGQSPAALILSLRLEQAAAWLRETDAKVNEVAYGVGFKSVPHFNRTFRERFGVTPTAYRGSAR